MSDSKMYATLWVYNFSGIKWRGVTDIQELSLCVGWDGRYNSPEHIAKLCTYVFINGHCHQQETTCWTNWQVRSQSSTPKYGMGEALE